MKVIFMGSGGFACEQLKALHKSDIEVLSVITQPKRKFGRKKELKGTPVCYLSEELGYEVVEAGKSKEIVDQVNLEEADFLVVADYGVLLKQNILDAPKIDCINVHGSILPFYRGASPIQTCLLNGDDRTGVTIMRMVKAMDAGDVYKIVEYEIQEEDVAPVLYEKLAKLGGQALVKTLKEIYEDGLKPVPQNDEKATYCGKIEKRDGEVDFMNESAKDIWNKYRAYYFWPKIYFIKDGKRYIVHECNLKEKSELNAGDFDFDDEQEELLVGTRGGVLGISEIQPEGKQKMDVKSFWLGSSHLFG